MHSVLPPNLAHVVKWRYPIQQNHGGHDIEYSALRSLDELLHAFGGLVFRGLRNNQFVVSGKLGFEASFEGLETISEDFDIEITVPKEFPHRSPRTREIGGRIESNYEHVFTNGNLCLGIPIEVRRVICEEPTLLGYTENLVVPYLYGFCYWQRHGKHPFGEADHGAQATLDYYVNLFNTSDPSVALSVVCFIYEFGYQDHRLCPCGSGHGVRNCHRNELRLLCDIHNEESLSDDLSEIRDACIEISVRKKSNLRDFLPKSLYKQVTRVAVQISNTNSARKRART